MSASPQKELVSAMVGCAVFCTVFATCPQLRRNEGHPLVAAVSCKEAHQTVNIKPSLTEPHSVGHTPSASRRVSVAVACGEWVDWWVGGEGARIA